MSSMPNVPSDRVTDVPDLVARVIPDKEDSATVIDLAVKLTWSKDPFLRGWGERFLASVVRQMEELFAEITARLTGDPERDGALFELGAESSGPFFKLVADLPPRLSEEYGGGLARLITRELVPGGTAQSLQSDIAEALGA